MLQEHRFERVGDNSSRVVDVRVIAATNRDLGTAVREGRFRDDLYHRLNVYRIDVPPLRERREDVVLLAEHFLRRAAERHERPAPVLDEATRAMLERYDWPGNIRELENLMERAVIDTDDDRPLRVLVDDCLGDWCKTSPRACDVPAGDTVLTEREARERDLQNLLGALRLSEGRIFGRGGAAELLGVPPTTLASRIRTLGIDRQRFRRTD